MNFNPLHTSEKLDESTTAINQPSLSQLPKDYYESIINWENKLLLEKTIDTIETLINLYRVRVF